MRPWNELISDCTFWDPHVNNGRGGEVQVTQTLKSRLGNPNGLKIEQLLQDVALGLNMVMEEIDKEDLEASEMKLKAIVGGRSTPRLETLAKESVDISHLNHNDPHSAQQLSGALWNYITDRTDLTEKALMKVATQYGVENTIRSLFLTGRY